MKYPAFTIEKKKYVLIPNEEYLILKQDMEDLKKVYQRRNESGMEASAYFKSLKKVKPKTTVSK